jgi:transcriptional regulator with XRE-family HTH domain
VTPGDEWAAATLKALRLARKLTQQQLADAASLDRSVMNALENGRRPMSDGYARKLGKALKVKPKALLPPADPQPEVEKSPLARLEELEAEVAWLREWVGRGFSALGVAPELQDEARHAQGNSD